MKCLLCKEKEANQTGSHIFTSSLVKSCLNVEGKNGRDNELIFDITEKGGRKVFVGKETPIDKVNDVFGREMTDPEIKDNSNEIVVDNIYCRDCEKLFGEIESPFSTRILQKIRNNHVLEFQSPDNILIRLYFYIQIWRGSSYNFKGWSLNDKKLEEELRLIILEGCSTYQTGISKELEESIIKFPIVVNYLETPSGSKSTNWVFFPDENQPYYLFLCDFVIEFFSKQVDIQRANNLFGLNNDIEEVDINFNEENFFIRKIANDRRGEINKELIMPHANIVSEKLKNRVISEYEKRTGIQITQDKLDLYREKYFFDFENVPLAQRWTDERFEEILNEVIEND